MNVRNAVSIVAGLVVLAVIAGFAAAQDQAGDQKITIIADGKSAYSIVVPDGEDPRDRVRKAADYLQSTLKEATTVLLPIVRESQHSAGKPAIYLGKTKAAIQAKLPVSDLSGWAYLKAVRKSDIFLIGSDAPGVGPRLDEEFLGTLKAVLSFLQDEAGVRFVLPGPNGVHIPKMDSLAVSSTLMVLSRPAFPNGTSSKLEPIYDIANNYTKAYLYKSYGGHSYYDAVPKKTYAKTHPEYFALIDGKRNSKHNHLCISNPEVQKLMVVELEKQMDLGYQWVQLAQTDGYHECECGACRAISADKTERLHIVHRKIAEEVRKSRPGKQIMILAYGPTANPPKTFKQFPDNVTFELCDYGEGDFAKWRSFGSSFFTYVYNWGFYHEMGILPLRTPQFAASQIRRFARNNVAGIYKCGFGGYLGLEGPTYYVYGQMMGNPELDEKKLTDDFYRAAYGNAYAPMKKFFDALYKSLEMYQRLELFPTEGFQGDYGKLPHSTEEMICWLFPPKLLLSMERNLSLAKSLDKDSKVAARLRLVEKEFLYVKNVATICHLYRAYQLKPTWTNFNPLAAKLLERKQMIDSFYDKDGKMIAFDGWPKFLVNIPKKVLLVHGRLRSRLPACFKWDITSIREKQILPGVR